MNVAWFRDNFIVIFVWSVFIICLTMFMIFMYPKPIFTTDKSMYVKEEVKPKLECLVTEQATQEQTIIKEEVKPIVYNITINNYSNVKNKNSKEILLNTKDIQILIDK